MSYWLAKSEPSAYSFADLLADGVTVWDGVRNFQARNFISSMIPGDQVVFYHSNADPSGVAGLAEVVSVPFADPSQFDPQSRYFDPRASLDRPRWTSVRLSPVRQLEFVPLDVLRRVPQLQGSQLLAKGNRLSVLPLTADEFAAIVAAAG